MIDFFAFCGIILLILEFCIIMIYGIIISVLAVLFGLRAFSCIILREDRSQIMMCLVYVIYMLFTVNHRFLGGSVYSDNGFNFISYFLLTANYILVGEYIRSIYHNKVYTYIMIGLYAALIILMINQYVLCFFDMNGLFFLTGMCEMSVIFVIVGVVFLIKDFKKLSSDIRLLIVVTDFMVLCLVMILVFNLLDMKRDVYWFALGILLYIVSAEYVSMKRIRRRLSDFAEIDHQMQYGIAPEPKQNAASGISQNISGQENVQQNTEELKGTLQTVFNLMISDENQTAKSIAYETDLSVNTVKSYMSQIYSHFGVHSRAEFHQKIGIHKHTSL